jgi:hypothetical protein
LRPPHRSPPALPHVEHLHPDCRLAVFDGISIRHLIRPSFRHASKERFEAGPHLPKLTKGQRLDASDLLEFLFFWWGRPIHSKGARTSAASAPIGPRARL